MKKKDKICLAFGYFDGMHIGHQAVIKELAGETGYKRIVISFEDRDDSIIYTEKEKQYYLKSRFPVEMVSLDKAEYESRTAEEFCKEILIGRFSAEKVVFGENFCNLDTFLPHLEKNGIESVIVPTVKAGDVPVSADIVIEAVKRDDVSKVLDLLGGSYLVRGIVVHGKGVGRKFGLPTANVKMQDNKIYPPYGVYGARLILNGTSHKVMTNVGIRPSDDDNPKPTVESYILDFDEDIYDEEVIVELKCFVRKIRKFPGGLKEVKEQVEKDIETVKSTLKEGQ